MSSEMDYFFRILQIVLYLKSYSHIGDAAPRLIKAIDDIEITYCQNAAYDFSKNFQDFNSLQLLDSSFKLFSDLENDEIYFDEKNKTLYIVPVLSSAKTLPKVYQLVLRAIDAEGNRVDENFTVTFTGQLPKYLVLFQFKFIRKFESQPATIKDLYIFLEKLGGRWKTEKISVFEYTTLSQIFTIISVIDCTLFTSNCPRNQIEGRKGAILDPTNSISQDFKDNLRPEFESIDNFDLKLLEVCKQSKINSKPVYNLLSSFETYFLISQTTVNVVTFPNDTYRDEEDGDLFNLRVELFSKEFKFFDPSTSWIGFGNTGFRTNKTLYIAVMDSTIAYLNENKVKFIMRIFDQQGQYLDSELTFEYDPLYISQHNYTMEMNFTFDSMSQYIYAQQIYTFLKNLKTYLRQQIQEKNIRNVLLSTDERKIYMRSYEIYRTEGDNGYGTLRWSVLMSTKCKTAWIKAIQEAVFENGNSGELKNSLKQSFEPQFAISTAADFLTNLCNVEKPIINQEIPTLTIPYCGLFRYKIPENTFIDNQDGNTRNLALRLQSVEAASNVENNILHLEEKTQVLFSILSSKVNYSKTRKYKLIATDSTDQTAEFTFEVSIEGSPRTEHSFLVNVVLSFPASSINKPDVLFFQKLEKFFSIEGTDLQLIEQIVKKDSYNVVFTNCSLRQAPCDVIGIKYMQDLLEPDGEVNQYFVNVLKPEFDFTAIVTTKRDPCKKDNIPVVVEPIKDIIVSSCTTTVFKIPENIFNDPEQGTTSNLSLDVSIGDNDQLLTANSYISFKQSEFVIVATDSQKSSNLRIRAKDINGGEAILDFDIIIKKFETQPNHKFIMKLTQTSNQFSNFVQLFDALRQRIKSYFDDEDNVDTVQLLDVRILKGGFSLNSKYEVIWSNCTLSRTTCEKTNIADILSKMKGSNNQINSQFKKSLGSLFDVTNITLEYTGSCAPKHPRVNTVLPLVKASFCGFLEYKIPAETFTDEVDINTRNLKLSLSFSNGSSIPPNYWVYFDILNQNVIVIASVTDKTIKQKGLNHFKLHATNSLNLTTSADLKIEIINEPLKLSYVFQIIFYFEGATNTFVMKKIIQKLITFYGQDLDSFYIYSASSSDEIYFIEFTSCNSVYEPCDREFISKLGSLSKESGKASSKLENFITPYFIILVNDRLLGDICKPPSFKPKVVKPIQPFTVGRCGVFSVSFDKESFNDEEDGANLQYFIMSINGETVSQESQWVGVNSQEYQFYGVVTKEIFLTSIRDYIILLRAQDSSKLSVDTNVSITVKNDKNVNSYYEFQLQLEVSNSQSDLNLKIDVVKKIQDYIGSSVEIQSYSKTGSLVEIGWISCDIPSYCSKQDIDSLSTKIFLSSEKVNQSFSSLFQGDMKFKNIVLKSDPKCNEPLDPPKPLLKRANIEMTVCGGYQLTLRKDIFVDKQDGNITNLSLRIITDSQKRIRDEYYWSYFDDSSKKLYAYPTLDQAIKFNKDNANKLFYIEATDSSGLQSFIELNLSFKIPNDPKFFFTFSLQQTPSGNNLLLLAFDFAEKLQSFRNDASYSSIAYTSITANSVTYFNCSISYKPCDIAQLTHFKNSYSNDNGRPTQSLITSFGQGYKVQFITSSKLSPCGEGNTPPFNRRAIGTIIIYMCDHETYTIYPDTFYDYEDGYALTYSIKSKDNIGYTEWLYFNSVKKEIAYNGYADVMNRQPTGGFTFSLIATDSSGLSSSIDVKMLMQGPYSVLVECAIEMLFEFNEDITKYTNVQIDQHIVVNLALFLGIDAREIGIVYGKIESATTYRSRWSYCSSSYKNYKSNTNAIVPGYRSYYYKVLKKVFQVNGEPSVAFYNYFQRLTTVKKLIEVKTVFTGRCSNFPPFIDALSEINLNIQYGGYISYLYPSDLFVDFEDGDAYSLQLKMLTSTYTEAAIDNWIHVDVSVNTIYAVTTSLVRQSQERFFIYYLRAVDKGGKYADIKIIARKTFTFPSLSPFNITYETYWQGSFNSIFVNQSVFLINQIFSYFQLTSRYHVLVWWYYRSNGFPESRYITWSIANETCNSDVFQVIKSLTSFNQYPSEFSNTFGKNFNLSRLYYQTTCSADDSTKPIPNPNPFTPPNITFCNLYSYKIQVDQFADNKDLDLKNMQVRLLNDAGVPVSKTSWIQINQASLEIYAIAIRSVFRISNVAHFQLQAINSVGLATSIKFKLNINDLPFTSDCPITMKFKYKFETSYQVNLDILWKVVESISRFYNDRTINIKVLQFYQQSSWYFLQWSNCSSMFQFSSKSQAQVGMTEEQKFLIEAIFSEVVTSENKITAKFKSFMSADFEIEYVSASYCCIEKPPQAKKDKIQTFASFCRTYKEEIEIDLFNDECDGDLSNLELSFHYPSGRLVNINEWVQLDKAGRFIYGVVTELVRRNQKPAGFDYLLAATDYSGRQTVIPFNVRITDNIQSLQVYFVTGFTNYYSSKTPAVFVLYRLKEVLGDIINPGANVNNVYIKSYRYPKEIIWSYCKLDPCKTNAPIILQSVQETLYENAPSKNLISQLSPNIHPFYSMIHMLDTKCANAEINIIVNVFPPINLTTCGNFTLQLPENLFRGSNGRSNKNFYIEATQATDINGGALKRNLWIEFDIAYQHFHGVAIIDMISKANKYFVQATHPISGEKASTIVEINFPNYDIFTNKDLSYCQISTTVESNYQTAYEDITIIRNFISTLSKYLGKLSSDIQILKFTKTVSLSQIQIIWTDCFSVIKLSKDNSAKQYSSSLEKTLTAIFENYENTNTLSTNTKMVSFFNSFSSFKIISNSVSDFCIEPPNTPPNIRPKSNPYTITVPNCGYYETNLPDDLFNDEQDGDIKNLNLQLQYKNLQVEKDSWVILRDYSIWTLPENKTLTQYPKPIGYQYELIATDKGGLSTSLTLIIKIENPIPYLPPAVSVIITGSNKIESAYALIDKISIVLSISTVTGIPSTDLFMTGETSFSVSPFKSVVAICGRCDQNIYKLFAIDIAKAIEILKPAFDVSISPTKKLNLCSQVLDKYNADNRRVPYCKTGKYDLGAQFNLKEFPDLKVIFRDANEQQLSQQSMAWFNQETLEIEYFPKEKDFLDSRKITVNYTFWFEQNNELFSLKNFLISTLDERNTSIEYIVYRMQFKTTLDSNNIDNYFVSKIMKILQDYITQYEVVFFNFRRLSTNPLTFTLDWKICFPKSNTPLCSQTLVEIIKSQFYDEARKLKIDFINLFAPDFQLESVTSNCENSKPTVDRNITLDIPACGVLHYELPTDISSDKEDGGLENLRIELRNFDMTPLKKETYIDTDSRINKSIIALSSEISLDSITTEKEIFTLRFYDSNDAYSQSFVTANLLGKVTPHKSYFNLKFLFTSNYPVSTSYVKLQYYFLEKLAAYSGDNTMSYYHIETLFEDESTGICRIIVANCTINENVCPQVASYLDTLERKLKIENQVNQVAKDFFLQDFVITNIELEEYYSVDKAPILTTSFSKILLKSCCEVQALRISDKDISDQVTPYNQLRFNLAILNKTDVSGYFLYEATLKDISFVPIGNVKPGTYKFQLNVTDSCENVLQVLLHTEVQQQCLYEFGYLITFEIKRPSFFSSVQFIRLLKVIIKGYFNRQSDDLSVTRFQEYQETFEITFGNCTVKYEPCDKDTIQYISSKFVKNGNISDEFKQVVSAAGFTFINAHEYFSKQCSNESIDPPKAKEEALHFNVTTCSSVKISLENDLFYDDKNNTISNFRLEFLSENKNKLASSEWIYLSTADNKLIGYPIINSKNPKRRFTYYLRGYGRNNLYTDIMISISIYGDVPPLSYQLILSASIIGQYDEPDPFYSTKLLHYLEEEYSEGNLNLVIFQRNNIFKEDITMTFSFCRERRGLCDCRFIKSTQENPINSGGVLKYQGTEFAFKQIAYELYNECKNNEEPRIQNSAVSVFESTIGQYHEVQYPDNTFVDREDGLTENLTLVLLNERSEVLKTTDWLKINDNLVCGIMPVMEFFRRNFELQYTYGMRATDACGSSAKDFFTVNFVNSGIDTNKYYILLLDENYSDFVSNCSKIELFIDTVEEFIKMKNDVYILDISPYHNITNGTEIKWAVKKETTITLCDGSTKNITEKVVTSNEDSTFFKHLKSVGFDADDIALSCPVLQTTTTTPKPPTEIPYLWLIILFIVLFALLLLLFCLWLLIPRLCKNCCKSGICFECCGRGGRYSSKGEDPENGTMIQPTYVDDTPIDSPDFNSRPKEGDLNARKASTASQTDPLPQNDDDKTDRGDGYNSERDRNYGYNYNDNRTTDNRYSSSVKEDTTFRERHSLYDHTHYRSNDFKRSEEKVDADKLRNWSVESWKDPRPYLKRNQYSSDTRYRTGRSSRSRGGFKEEIFRDRSYRSNRGNRGYSEEIRTDFLDGKSDALVKHGDVYDKYDGNPIDPELITLTLPRNIIEEYLERRFQRIKGRRRQRSSSRKRKYLVESSHLADALTDDTAYRTRGHRQGNGNRYKKERRRYFTSDSSFETPRLKYKYIYEPSYYYSTDSNGMYTTETSPDDDYFYDKRNAYTRHILGTARNRKRYRRRRYLTS